MVADSTSLHISRVSNLPFTADTLTETPTWKLFLMMPHYHKELFSLRVWLTTRMQADDKGVCTVFLQADASLPNTRNSELELCNCNQYTAAQHKHSIMQLQGSQFRAALHWACYQQKAGSIAFHLPGTFRQSCRSGELAQAHTEGHFLSGCRDIQPPEAFKQLPDNTNVLYIHVTVKSFTKDFCRSKMEIKLWGLIHN